MRSKDAMWQSRVENYSVAYFDRITAFEMRYLRTSIKGRTHMWCVVASIAAAGSHDRNM